jgi:DNA-binding MarR family transcriptional regulator
VRAHSVFRYPVTVSTTTASENLNPAEMAAQCPTDSPLNGPAGEAWFGLLHTHAALVRQVDAELLARQRISLSAFELLGRLAVSEEGTLSVTDLAGQVRISPSRVSRVVDELRRGGYLDRRACDRDARISYVVITDAGRDLLAEASTTFDDAISRHFLEALSDAEVEQLSVIWTKLLAASRERAAA